MRGKKAAKQAVSIQLISLAIRNSARLLPAKVSVSEVGIVSIQLISLAIRNFQRCTPPLVHYPLVSIQLISLAIRNHPALDSIHLPDRSFHSINIPSD